MELNPVLRRELRVQWRGDKAFMLLLLLSAALSVVMVGSYAVSGLGGQAMQDGFRLRSGGRSLFGSLSKLQLAAWLLICPVLAAPRIAFERERGLLEAMQLSGLSAARVVWGKFVGLVSFAFLMLLVTAPPMALCFVMGGVAPDEFTAVLALQTVTIYSGIALGLYFSSRARRPQEAVRNTLLILVLCLVFSTKGADLTGSAINYLVRIGMLDDETWSQSSYTIAQNSVSVLSTLSPFHIYEEIMADEDLQAVPGLTTRIYALPPQYGYPFSGYAPPGYRPPGFIPPGTRGRASASVINRKFLYLVALSTLLLAGAVAHTRRILPDPQWLERKKYLTVRNGRLAWTTDERAAPVAKTQNKHTFAPSTASSTTPSVWEVPLASFINFANPVLQREARGLMRLRHHSKLVTALIYGATAAGIIGYVWTMLWMAGFPQAGAAILQNVMLLVMLIVMIAAPLRGAQALARERENGTWENLRLSLLSPREILWGKALAPLLPLCALAVITAPLWFIGVLFGMDLRYASNAISPTALFFGWLLLFSTTFFLTCWGLWIAWRCRSAVAASGWALGSTLVLAAFSYFRMSGRYVDISLIHLIWNLFGSLWGTYVYGIGSPSSPIGNTFTFLLWIIVAFFASPFVLFANFFSSFSIMSALFTPYGYYSWDGPNFGSILFIPGLQCVAGLILLHRLEKAMQASQILEHETRPVNWQKTLREWPTRLNKYLESVNHPRRPDI